MNKALPILKEKIYDSGHKWESYVSEVWNSSENKVIESHFGIIIEVYRDDKGKLRRVWKSMIEKHLNTKTYTACNCKMIQYYQIYEENDKTEGRGGKTLKHVSLDKDIARKLSKNLGVWGGNGEVREVRLLEINFPNGSKVLMDDSKVDSEDKVYHELSLARIKDAILMKLSDEEIGILNI